MTKEEIQNILEISVNAPSGHNSQPWEFSVKENVLSVFNNPEKDKTLFNYKQRGSLVSCGAVIENIVITAAKNEYSCEVNLCPDSQNNNLLAKIVFGKKEEPYKYEYLYSYISKRTTNRRPYKKTPLKKTDSDILEKITNAESRDGYSVLLRKDDENISDAGKFFSTGDSLLFSNKEIHYGLFSNVNWTLKEEKERRAGLYLKTKELPFFVRLAFKYIISNWNILKRLQKIGFPKIAAKKRENLYKKTSIIGLIVAANDSDNAVVTSGRILQRIWLQATSAGISFQPLSVGLLYLAQDFENEKSCKRFSDKQVKSVKHAYSKICKEIFHIKKGTPTFSFRMGYSSPPTASSLKKKPKIIFEE